MTSEGLGDVFEGDSADTSAGKFPLMLIGGPSGGSIVCRPGSEDPHWRERKLLSAEIPDHPSSLITQTYISTSMLLDN